MLTEDQACEWRQAVKLAKHHRALGHTHIYLKHDQHDKPWHLVTEVEPGGLMRLGQSVSVWFIATHPKSGLRFRWSLDLEPREANGSGNLQIDVAGCRAVLEELPAPMAAKFRAHLERLAGATEKQAQEYLTEHRRWAKRAQELRSI